MTHASEDVPQPLPQCTERTPPCALRRCTESAGVIACDLSRLRVWAGRCDISLACMALLFYQKETMTAACALRCPQEMILYLQRLPTRHWSEKEVESVLSRAYMWRASFDQAKSHLSHQ